MGSPAAASLGIADLLRGSPIPGLIRGTTSGGGWLDLGGHVVVVSGPAGPRLPNEITVTGLTLPGDDPHCVAGDSCLRIGEVEIDVVRWWNPRASIPPIDLGLLALRAGRASRLLDCPQRHALCDAIRERDPVAIRTAARALLGRGHGLTPEGDDILVGALAALELLGRSIAETRAETALKALAPVVQVEAPFRTSDLSTALLRHALAGETAEPLGTLIRSLAGRGDVAAAVAGLESLGATSGIAMGCGVVLAAIALTEGAGE